MAKMRATLRKVAQVTPPPSPKNGDDIKQCSEWASRLRHHPKSSDIKKSPLSKKHNVIKKEIYCIQSDDLNCSHPTIISSNSPPCPSNQKQRINHHSGEATSYWGPRRSARLIGIPAELESCCEDKNGKSRIKSRPVFDESKCPKLRPKLTDERMCGENGCCQPVPEVSCVLPIVKEEMNGDDPSETEDDTVKKSIPKESVMTSNQVSTHALCLPLKKRRIPQFEDMDSNGALISDDAKEVSESLAESNMQVNGLMCSNCKPRRKRLIDDLLRESEQFMQYPSRSSYKSRSTYNSRDTRPPNPSPPASGSNLLNVNQVQFSFEMIPTHETWYQTFQREGCSTSQEEISITESAAPFLLPYEMSLETILKKNRLIRQKQKKRKIPQFRPIISTRLQMQSAAKQSQKCARLAEEYSRHSISSNSSCSSTCNMKATKRRKSPWLESLPRKSPRCHASTLAMLCAKQSTNGDSQLSDKQTDVPDEECHTPCKTESETNSHDNDPDDNSLDDVLERILNCALVSKEQTDTEACKKRKRGRPRKYPLATTSLGQLLATPLEKIEEIVDERILQEEMSVVDHFDDDITTLIESIPENLALDVGHFAPVGNRMQNKEPEKVFHEVYSALDTNSDPGSSSNSVYETASDLGSTSTSGTCNSRKKWRRRKRPNLTGWPRTRKKKPVNHIFSSDLSEMDTLSEAPYLSPCREALLEDVSYSEPPTLSTIHEESGSKLSELEETEIRESTHRETRMDYKLSKPFQFQRKTLKFVGKRILRQAAQRHAPQRLEYWPCFTSYRKRKRRKP